MKLSSDTLGLLKNFATISTGIYVPGGSKFRVKDSKNRVVAEAKVAENFPSFCVEDLSKFMGILTFDKDVVVDFKGPNVVLTVLGGKSKINYRCSPQNLVNVPKDTDLTINKEDALVSFTLTKENFAYLQKVTSLLALPCIAIENDGADVYTIRAFDPKNDSENSQILELGATGNGGKFQLIFEQEALNFIDGDYDVLISKSRGQFKHKKLDLTYWVALELGSSFVEE